ncbi:MAG: ABC transporter permease [Peptococcaceae bacterium]
MRRLAAAIRNDIYLQIRYGFYGVYLIVTVVYILLLKNIPDYFLSLALPFIIFSDPAFLGFYFIGGLVLLEKGENVLEYLVSTPLREREYIFAKIVSLTILALLASLAVAFFTAAGHFKVWLLVAGVLLSSVFYTAIGFIAVARFRTVNEYLMSSLVYMTVLSLPLLDFFRLYQSWFFYLFPTQASLILIRGAFQGAEPWQLAYGIIYLSLWIVLLFKWAGRAFYRFIILKEGAA